MKRLVLPVVVLLVLGLALTVTAAPSNSDWVVVQANRKPSLSLTLNVPTVDFGDVDPAGANAQAGITVLTDDDGAKYIYPAAIMVKVKSNTPWYGEVSAVSSNSNAMPESRLSYRLAGTSDPFKPFSQASQAIWGSAAQPLDPDKYSYTYDYQLEVLWRDIPGSYNITITYTAIQVP